jgi:hypothetical protein
MIRSVSAVCETTTSIPDDGHRSEDDLFRNAALVPTSMLASLEVAPYGYLEVRPQSGQGQPAADTTDWATGVYVQAIPLAEDFEYRTPGGQQIISMRTNVLRTISDSLAPGDVVDVRAAAVTTAGPLRVKRSYADDHIGERCYIDPTVRSQLGLKAWRDSVELVHPGQGHGPSCRLGR